MSEKNLEAQMRCAFEEAVITQARYELTETERERELRSARRDAQCARDNTRKLRYAELSMQGAAPGTPVWDRVEQDIRAAVAKAKERGV